jgi:succinate dehydrogenase hydrophobic anchor subunit
MENRFAGQPRPSTAWLWQAATGGALLLLLGLHFVAQHFVAVGGLRGFSDVVAYLRNPVILGLELLFLMVVTSHALLGVRSILFDLGLSAMAERRITRALAVVGMLTMSYGMWLTWIIIR